jgi:hypothetical protein
LENNVPFHLDQMLTDSLMGTPEWARCKQSVPPKYGGAGAFLAFSGNCFFSRGEVSPKSEIKN